MKKIFYATVFLITTSFTASAQSKIAELKQKKQFHDAHEGKPKFKKFNPKLWNKY